MKKLTIVALSLIAASAAMAEGLSREQVVAELQRARTANQLQLLHSENPDFGRSTINTASVRSRSDVLAELQQARDSGELARQNREGGDSIIPAATSTKTRAEVLAELQRARASGELVIGNRNEGGYAHLDALNQSRSAASQQLLAGQAAAAQ